MTIRDIAETRAAILLHNPGKQTRAKAAPALAPTEQDSTSAHRPTEKRLFGGDVLCLEEIDLDGAVAQIEDDLALKIAEK
ncbi:MAG: hypothetical protein LUE89_09010 [Clostridiales bacterium]|nr:hypothetical protein [Clostridiales bacterium]